MKKLRSEKYSCPRKTQLREILSCDKNSGLQTLRSEKTQDREILWSEKKTVERKTQVQEQLFIPIL